MLQPQYQGPGDEVTLHGRATGLTKSPPSPPDTRQTVLQSATPSQLHFFCLSYRFRHFYVQIFFFFPDRHYYRKLWSFLLLPCISICLLLTLLHTPPPRVRFLHPSHQSLCSQSDLKTADSCWSCVCSSFRKMYSP